MRIDDPRRLFIPSIAEIISYLVISLVILAATNFSRLINVIGNGVPIDKAEFQKSLTQQLSGISNSGLVNTAIIVIFWSLVGLVVYTIFWLLLNVLTGVKNEVVVESDYVNKASLGERIKIPVLQATVGIVVLAYAALCIKLIYPLWIDLARQFLAGLATVNLQIILMGLASIIGSWFTLYIGVTLAKLVASFHN